MKTKTIQLKNGQDLPLYFIESEQRWTASLVEYHQSTTNIERLMEGRIDCSDKMRSTIMKYYDETSEMNRHTINRMINESVDNIPVVYDMILTSIINKKRK